MHKRRAFTLIEVLVSIALLGVILVPLFSVVDMMRKSNEHLLRALKSSQEVTKASKVLFLDILSSDGTLFIKKDEFARLCIEETKNSLYNLPVAKVCWVVLKNKNTLVRIEGYDYKLPLKSEDKVEVDLVVENVDFFDVYQQDDKVVVLLKQQGKEPINFMLQGIKNYVEQILPDGTKKMKDGSKRLPDGTRINKDGSKKLPDGTKVPAHGKRKGKKANRTSKGRPNSNRTGKNGKPINTEIPNRGFSETNTRE